MCGGACHVKAYVKKLRHHALELQHRGPSGGCRFVPVPILIIRALFQIGAALGQNHKRLVLRWRFGRLRGE
jgi:hypothetical protein